MELLKESVSKEGWAKIQGAIQTNASLAELCDAAPILNSGSYFFLLFGVLSMSDPWGYTFFGHHTCLNFLFRGEQMVLSPFFVGAEPNLIDRGQHQGIAICTAEEELGLLLMQSLQSHLQDKTQIYKQMHGPDMPEWRWNPADQRHLAGAFQDNRIIPYVVRWVQFGCIESSVLCPTEEDYSLVYIPFVRPKFGDATSLYPFNSPVNIEGFSGWQRTETVDVSGADDGGGDITTTRSVVIATIPELYSLIADFPTPYEGVAASEMSTAQREQILRIAASLLELLPPRPLQARLQQIRKQLDENYFCWIGGYGNDDSFYYRI
ncbi:hypothetical protein AYL99_08702 [Fonsecaea erecta]|uniref:DUF3500 domain-containing protein n=1 Tax=Fonsecaea erecta TaxID=1367422 RepID=A0A178Z9Y9_9EURO|nr:hypothetical protein AYL99_08702 [Fonsecaea erecta]OAP56590.1 hypothetical protein AYL99_08702 [Fonsecaea erecta]